jgi:SAM-dependent methyltransferase
VSTDPHERRDLAEGFGSDADRYDRARPGYPVQLADAVLSGLPSARVVDAGIGTGISARIFTAAGADVLGVEPDDRMAEVARSRGFDVEISRFEDWDARGRTFDAVVSGQAWHWIEPVAGAQKAADVLRPGGRLAVFWNVAQPPAELAAAFADVYRRVETGLPFTPWAAPEAGYTGFTERAKSGIRRCGRFCEPALREFTWSESMTTATWLDQVPTAGGHDRIAPERLAELLAGMGAAIQAVGGSFDLAFTTVAVLADRIAP